MDVSNVEEYVTRGQRIQRNSMDTKDRERNEEKESTNEKNSSGDEIFRTRPDWS
jgi:hypothetical protein